MNPETTAKMDQAAAALRDIAVCISSMVSELKMAGVSPDVACRSAVSLFECVVWSGHDDPA